MTMITKTQSGVISWIALPCASFALLAGCPLSHLNAGYDYSTGGGGAGGGTGGGPSSTSASSGTGGGFVCSPGAMDSCYDGPSGTQGKGVCKAGVKTCGPDGLSYGPCEGQVLPSTETCLTPEDDDCNGQANEGGAGCVCAPGESMICYSGPMGTAGTGVCKAGTQTCTAQGTGYGPCQGEVVPTFDDCVTPADEDCDGVASSCSGGHVWSDGFGGVNEQLSTGDQKAIDVVIDKAGNAIVVGDLSGSPSFGGVTLNGAGGTDVFILKLDPAGNVLWAKRFGDASDQHATGVTVDAVGNIALTGSFSGAINFGGGQMTSAGLDDVFVAALAPDGSHLWSKRYGGASTDIAGSIAADSTGAVLLTGGFAGSVNFGGGMFTSAGGSDVFLVKLDSSGSHVWSKQFGDPSSQFGVDVAVDASNDIVITGKFSGTVNFGNGPHVSAGGSDVFVAKFDGSGNRIWSKGFGSVFEQSGFSVALDGAGNVLVAGAFIGTIDFGGGPLTSVGGTQDLFLAKLNGSGAHLWSKSFGNNGSDYGSWIAVDGAGNVLLTTALQGTLNFGGSNLTSTGVQDALLVKLDSSGGHLWSKRFGDMGDQTGRAVAVDNKGQPIMVGSFTGTIDFGGNALVSGGGYDMFVARFTP